MRFYKYLFALIFLTGSILAEAQSDTALSLQQCVDIAIKNNLTVKQDSLTALSARIKYRQSMENLFPSINGSASRNLTSGRGLNPVTNTYITQSITSDNYGLNGSVTVFNGLAMQNAVKQASLSYQSGKMAFQAAKDLITVNVITTYLQVLDAQELFKESQSQLAVAKENVDIAKTKNQYGAIPPSNYSDFRGSYAASQVAVVQAQNSLASMRLSLFNLMNMPYDENQRLLPLNAEDLTGEYGTTPDKVYQTALQQMAQVKAATLARKSAEKEVKRYKGFLFPQLYLGSGISTNYSNLSKQHYFDQFRNNYGTYFQIGLNVPIFSNLQNRNNVALAKIDLENQRYIEDNTKVQLQQNVEQAYYNMTAAYKRYQALREEVSAYDESYKIAKVKLDAGVITSDLFLLAKNNSDAANMALISARYDYFIYSKILDYYQGKL